MPVTPRRSTRSSAVFTPTARAPLDATYEWTSAPRPGPSTRVHFTSYARTLRRQESRFAIGDGVVVALEGQNEGIGMVTKLYEEDEEAEEGDRDEQQEQQEQQPRGRRRMASVHWFFRKSDLPMIMRNVHLAEVSGVVCLLMLE